jgi:hypothetical protein
MDSNTNHIFQLFSLLFIGIMFGICWFFGGRMKLVVRKRIKGFDRVRIFKTYLFITGVLFLQGNSVSYFDSPILALIVVLMMVICGVTNVKLTDSEKEFLNDETEIKRRKREDRINSVLRGRWKGN